MSKQLNAVLLVDDDESILRGWIRSFRHRGYKNEESAERSVRSACSLADARAAARMRTPDLAVIDLFLGDGSGLDLVRELRRQDAHTAIVLVSGASALGARSAYEAGANQVLCKPLSIAEMIERVERGAPDPHTRTAADAARKHRLDVIADCGGNITRAAQLLGVSRQALQRRLRPKK